jgi:hypothetical protein
MQNFTAKCFYTYILRFAFCALNSVLCTLRYYPLPRGVYKGRT